VRAPSGPATGEPSRTGAGGALGSSVATRTIRVAAAVDAFLGLEPAQEVVARVRALKRRGRACSGGEVLALTADIPTGDTLRQLAWRWVDERLGIFR
jgi:hypothetical protein